eukprot:Opistho-1_new@16820
MILRLFLRVRPRRLGIDTNELARKERRRREPNTAILLDRREIGRPLQRREESRETRSVVFGGAQEPHKVLFRTMLVPGAARNTLLHLLEREHATVILHLCAPRTDDPEGGKNEIHARIVPQPAYLAIGQHSLRLENGVMEQWEVTCIERARGAVDRLMHSTLSVAKSAPRFSVFSPFTKTIHASLPPIESKVGSSCAGSRETVFGSSPKRRNKTLRGSEIPAASSRSARTSTPVVDAPALFAAAALSLFSFMSSCSYTPSSLNFSSRICFSVSRPSL